MKQLKTWIDLILSVCWGRGVHLHASKLAQDLQRLILGTLDIVSCMDQIPQHPGLNTTETFRMCYRRLHYSHAYYPKWNILQTIKTMPRGNNVLYVEDTVQLCVKEKLKTVQKDIFCGNQAKLHQVPLFCHILVKWGGKKTTGHGSAKI